MGFIDSNQYGWLAALSVKTQDWILHNITLLILQISPVYMYVKMHKVLSFQDALGDVVYCGLPDVGQRLEQLGKSLEYTATFC